MLVSTSLSSWIPLLSADCLNDDTLGCIMDLEGGVNAPVVSETQTANTKRIVKDNFRENIFILEALRRLCDWML